MFFFKQKTAYEIAQCLVGSEMCIRDRCRCSCFSWAPSKICLLYTSDAADDSLRVDLGGRRIIKKISVPVSYTHLTLPT
ncbi:hypothetical protein, partial [Staphylococcus aureus]